MISKAAIKDVRDCDLTADGEGQVSYSSQWPLTNLALIP